MQKILLITTLLNSLIQAVQAQTPQNYPPPVPEPFEINLFSVLLYIVLPLMIVVAYIWIRKSKRKKPH